MEINYGKDVGFEAYAKIFEKDVEMIDWNAVKLSPEEKSQMEMEFQGQLKKRLGRMEQLVEKYITRYENKTGMILPKKEISYQLFLDNLEYELLLGQDFKSRPRLKKIYQMEKDHHQKQYNVDDYKKELPACIVVPTYNNEVDYRYGWHLESILQQEYSNYKMVIIDDMSKDRTSKLIARHLKWRNFPKDKVVLLRNKIHRTALENIYYAVHKYCDYNQIFYILDGDDEIVGTQVFKMMNALYQQKKDYVIWTNHFSYD
jgi:hypothetical protein